MRYLLTLSLIGVLLYSGHSYAQQLFKVSTAASAELLPNVIDNLRAAYKTLNIELEITLLPAQRALLEAQTNIVYDAELGRTKQAGKQLTNLIRIPVSLTELSLSALAQSEIQNLSGQSGINKLKNYRVASIRGIVISDLLLKDIDHHVVDRPKQGFDMLLYKRLDVFVIPNFMALSLPIELTKNGFIIHEPPLLSANIYHFVHKKHAALIPKITAAISEVSGNPIEFNDASTEP